MCESDAQRRFKRTAKCFPDFPVISNLCIAPPRLIKTIEQTHTKIKSATSSDQIVPLKPFQRLWLLLLPGKQNEKETSSGLEAGLEGSGLFQPGGFSNCTSH